MTASRHEWAVSCSIRRSIIRIFRSLMRYVLLLLASASALCRPPARGACLVAIPAVSEAAQHFLIAFDFDSLGLGGLTDGLDGVKDSLSDAATAAADAKASAQAAVADAKASALESVLTPVEEAKASARAALPPALADLEVPDVNLPRFGGGDADTPAGPFAAAKSALNSAGLGALLGGLVGGKVGWEARGVAQKAKDAKDSIGATIDKLQKRKA